MYKPAGEGRLNKEDKDRCDWQISMPNPTKIAVSCSLFGVGLYFVVPGRCNALAWQHKADGLCYQAHPCLPL